MRRQKLVNAAVVCVVLVAAVAGCGGGSGGGNKPAATGAGASTAKPVPLDQLVAQSRNENQLIIYGNAPAPYLKPVIDAFNRLYPWVSVQDTDLSDNEAFSKYESEHAQGARSADMLISSAPALWVGAIGNGVVRPTTPLGLENFPPFARQADGVFVMSPEPIFEGFNVKLLTPAQVPTSYAQLYTDVQQDPGRYKLVSYPPTQPFGYAAVYGLVHILGWDTVWKYFDVYSPHTKTFSEGLNGLQFLVQGGASVGYLSSGLAQGVLKNFKGLADATFMTDATPLIPRGIAVTAGASSPASAQLFLDFVFSDAGQQALCAAGFEAYENNFQPASGCTANLVDLYKHVDPSKTFLVPFSADVVNQQKAITDRWTKSFHG
jgi:iron(III) transport system substrate-binding protein